MKPDKDYVVPSGSLSIPVTPLYDLIETPFDPSLYGSIRIGNFPKVGSITSAIDALEATKVGTPESFYHLERFG